MKKSSLIPLPSALFLILLSTVIFSGSVGMGLFFWEYWQKKRASDPHYNVVAIVQSCKSQDALQTDFLAELLDLSVDQPTNLYAISLDLAKAKLLSFPVIKSAKIQKLKPGMLYIQYRLRRPFVYSGDYTNTAIDRKGTLIPFWPFFTPKNIPEVILGLPQNLPWGTRMTGKKIDLAWKLMKAIHQQESGLDWQLFQLDVSRILSNQWGRREIILTFTHQKEKKRFLKVRLPLHHWRLQLTRLHQLIAGNALKETDQVVDLRLPDLAFITAIPAVHSLSKNASFFQTKQNLKEVYCK